MVRWLDKNSALVPMNDELFLVSRSESKSSYHFKVIGNRHLSGIEALIIQEDVFELLSAGYGLSTIQRTDRSDETKVTSWMCGNSCE